MAHAYAPVYAVDLPFAAAHPELLMYRNDGAPQSFFDFIQLADPSNREWQRHFVEAYGGAADAIGFNGFHIDTYGYPRVATDREGHSIDMRAAYESFLTFFRSQRPGDLVSFNQVNGVPSALQAGPRAGLSLLRGLAPQRRVAAPGGAHGPQRGQGRTGEALS